MSNPKTLLARSTDHDDIVIDEMELRMPTQIVRRPTVYSLIVVMSKPWEEHK